MAIALHQGISQKKQPLGLLLKMFQYDVISESSKEKKEKSALFHGSLDI
jgi:hypothetical protein